MAADAADKASSGENKENEDMDGGSSESQTMESEKPASKLDSGATSAELMD